MQWLTSERFGSGSDGALTISGNTTDAPIDSACSGTSGTTSLTATNGSFAAGQVVLIHQTRGTGAGAWELNVIQSYVAGTITTRYNLANTYTNSGASVAQVLVLEQHSALTINNGITLTGKAWNGTVGGIVTYLVNGTATITGSITLVGKGFRGGSAQNDSNQEGHQGEGTTGAGDTHADEANGNGGGGGGKDEGNTRGSGGGGGGYADAGTQGSPSGGTPANIGGAGGVEVGSDDGELTTIFFGGGGGSGASNNGGSVGAAAGGAGGGMLIIIAKTITGTGTININGSNGAGGALIYNGGGGGGAGGAALFKGQIVDLDQLTITATAGSGSAGGSEAGAGGNGAVGRIHADYSATISGTTTPTLDSTQSSLFADVGGAALFGAI